MVRREKLALFISVASAATWQFSNQLAGETFSSPLIPVWNASTRLGVFTIVTILLTKLKKSYLDLQNMAQTDFLTKAANPRAFYAALETEVSRLRRYRGPFSVCYLDADNFKLINDTFGHNVGSDLLIKIVAISKANLRATDLIARLGGDEFVILLPETDGREVCSVVEKIRSKINSEMRLDKATVTLSIGVMTYLEPPDSADEAIKAADHLMYEVKRGGKNSVKFGKYGKTQSFAAEKQNAQAFD